MFSRVRNVVTKVVPRSGSGGTCGPPLVVQPPMTTTAAALTSPSPSSSNPAILLPMSTSMLMTSQVVENADDHTTVAAGTSTATTVQSSAVCVTDNTVTSLPSSPSSCLQSASTVVEGNDDVSMGSSEKLADDVNSSSSLSTTPPSVAGGEFGDSVAASKVEPNVMLDDVEMATEEVGSNEQRSSSLKGSDEDDDEKSCEHHQPMQIDASISEKPHLTPLPLPPASDSVMSTTCGENVTSLDQQVTLQDLRTFAECFYLPYEHGYTGQQLIKQFTWLKEQAGLLSRNTEKDSANYLEQASKWNVKQEEFDRNCGEIMNSFKRIIQCQNRALLYDVYPYISDMRGVINMLRSYVKWLGKAGVNTARDQVKDQQPINDVSTGVGWLGSDPEPWAYRGGLSGEFQRLLPVSGSLDLFSHVVSLEPQATTYIVRPYLPEDKQAIFDICYENSNEKDQFVNHKNLPGERLIGGFLKLSPEYSFVIVQHESNQVCGYIGASLHATQFWSDYKLKYLPELRLKYPKHDEEGANDLPVAVKDIIDYIHNDDINIDGSESSSSLSRYYQLSYDDIDKLMTSYPSVLTLEYLSNRNVTKQQPLLPHGGDDELNVIKHLMVCVLSALKSHSSWGVHTIVKSLSSPQQQHKIDTYNKLAFIKVAPENNNSAAVDTTTNHHTILASSF